MYLQKRRLRDPTFLFYDSEAIFNPSLIPYINSVHLQRDIAIPRHVQGRLEHESATT